MEGRAAVMADEREMERDIRGYYKALWVDLRDPDGYMEDGRREDFEDELAEMRRML